MASPASVNRSYVEQLRLEANFVRTPVSKTAQALAQYVEENMNSDPLVTGVSSSLNPYKEKSSCTLFQRRTTVIYMQRACACVFVDCWRLEHWRAAFEDIFRFRWFLSCALIPFSCSLTENLSSDLLFKHYFFICTRVLLLLLLQVIQMWFCDLSTLCKQRTI